MKYSNGIIVCAFLSFYQIQIIGMEENFIPMKSKDPLEEALRLEKETFSNPEEKIEFVDHCYEARKDYLSHLFKNKYHDTAASASYFSDRDSNSIVLNKAKPHAPKTWSKQPISHYNFYTNKKKQ